MKFKSLVGGSRLVKEDKREARAAKKIDKASEKVVKRAVKSSVPMVAFEKEQNKFIKKAQKITDRYNKKTK